MTIPAKILSSLEFCNNTCPKKVEAAPNMTKTIENPIVNKKVGVKFICFLFINSFNELPEIYEI
jgi:hypothetical protein